MLQEWIAGCWKNIRKWHAPQACQKTDGYCGWGGSSYPQEVSFPLAQAGDLDPLIDRIGDARFVLLGEASHGTSDSSSGGPGSPPV